MYETMTHSGTETSPTHTSEAHRLHLLLQESQEQRAMADAQRADAWRRAATLTEQLTKSASECEEMKSKITSLDLLISRLTGEAEQARSTDTQQQACLSGQLVASETQCQLLQEALVTAQKKERQFAGKAAAAECSLDATVAERDEAVRHLASSQNLLKKFQQQLTLTLEERDDLSRQLTGMHARLAAADSRLMEAEALEAAAAQRQAEAEEACRKAEAAGSSLREKHRLVSLQEKRLSAANSRLEAKEEDLAAKAITAADAKAEADMLHKESVKERSAAEKARQRAARDKEAAEEILISVQQERAATEDSKKSTEEEFTRLKEQTARWMKEKEEAQQAKASVGMLDRHKADLESKIASLRRRSVLSERKLAALKAQESQYAEEVQQQLSILVQMGTELKQQSQAMETMAVQMKADKRSAETNATQAKLKCEEAAEHAQRIDQGRRKLEETARLAHNQQLAVSAERRRLAAERLEVLNKAQTLRAMQLRLAADLRTAAAEGIPEAVASQVWSALQDGLDVDSLVGGGAEGRGGGEIGGVRGVSRGVDSVSTSGTIAEAVDVQGINGRERASKAKMPIISKLGRDNDKNSQDEEISTIGAGW